MDELQRWLAKGADRHPLDILNEQREITESVEALLRQAEQYNRIVAFNKTLPCVCGKVYPSGTILIRCPYHEWTS